MMHQLQGVLGLWVVWLASWVFARSGTKSTVATPRRGSERLYRIIAWAGVAMMIVSIPPISAGPTVWRSTLAVNWGLAGLAVAGFGICWWARIHLGQNWSWAITRKEDHLIVDTGPYAFVRHPIYTGLLIAAAATAMLEGKLLSLVGLALILLGLLLKARLEEQFLSAELGKKAYGDYSRRTGMLLPGL